MSSISIKKAAAINFISRYSNIFFQILINSILARLLSPQDYGIVAVISVFIGFFTIIADMGIGPAIIQNKNLDNKEISDIFIFTIIISIITAVGFILFSIPLAFFYENKVYINLGIILSVGIFFNIINIVPNAILLKQKQFKLLGIRTIIVTIICGIITIILALNNFKYYALVINSVIMGFLTFIMNLYISKIKIYFTLDMNSIHKIKDYATFQFGFNIINYFSRNLDNLLIGKVIGQNALGYYDKAYKMMLYPVQNLTYVITPVMHPILSEYQDEKEYIYIKYMKIIKFLSLIAVFICIFSYFSAKEIILIMFGKQWIKSIESFKILSLTIWIQIMMSSTGAIFQSTGNTKLLFKCGVITTSINVLGILIGIFFMKIEYVAIGIVISFSINLIITYYYLLNKVFNKKLESFLVNLKSTFAIGLILIIGLIFIKFEFENILINIFLKLILCIILYLIGLIITKEFEFMKSIIRK